jgi:TRAP-type mannitol/chloroaromatic compound transport system permease small subunit
MRKSPADLLFTAANGLFMLLFCLSILYPLWDVVVISFNGGARRPLSPPLPLKKARACDMMVEIFKALN